MIDRPTHLARVEDLLSRHPVVALLGARQVGKTTLSRMLARRWPEPVEVFDLEDPADLARLAEPSLVLRRLRGLVIIDEAQRRPDLFPLLRVLADREDRPARFLLLGSASPEVVQRSSESLAGRIAYQELGGFDLSEVGVDALRDLWLRGGLPRSFLAESDATSAEWRRQFVRSFLERDVPQLGVSIPAATLRRFWTMLAHYQGQTWNAAELARSLAAASSTVRRYLDLLEGTYVVRTLAPWFANLMKRQVKAPKVYLADAGLLHTLLGLERLEDLEAHPKLGASWEGFGIQTVVRALGARPEECFFWATHGGAELDLLIVRGNRKLGFEFKRTDAPRTTRSMRIALADLRLDRLDVVHAGEHTFPLDERIRAVALRRVLTDLEGLG